MQERAFSIGEVIKTGWMKFKEQPWTWIAALLLTGLILGTQPLATYLLTGDADGIDNERVVDQDQDSRGEERDRPGANGGEWEAPHQDPLATLVSFIYTLIQAGLSLGLTYMAIRAADGIPVQVGDLFARFQYFFYNFIAQFLYSLIVFVGLLLLIVPGVIWGLRYALYPYFIADKKVGPIQALKMSAEATQGVKWDLFKFMLVAFLIGLAGLMVFVVGLLVAIPVISIAMALIYRRLTNKAIPSQNETEPVNPSSISTS